MRYVSPAYSSAKQNLVACQLRGKIYFYTLRAVMPGQELLVWYCREFAQRLNYPETGELMLQRISKYSSRLCYLRVSSRRYVYSLIFII